MRTLWTRFREWLRGFWLRVVIWAKTAPVLRRVIWWWHVKVAPRLPQRKTVTKNDATVTKIDRMDRIS
jgi:hypothetical protein